MNGRRASSCEPSQAKEMRAEKNTIPGAPRMRPFPLVCTGSGEK